MDYLKNKVFGSGNKSPQSQQQQQQQQGQNYSQFEDEKAENNNNNNDPNNNNNAPPPPQQQQQQKSGGFLPSTLLNSTTAKVNQMYQDVAHGVSNKMESVQGSIKQALRKQREKMNVYIKMKIEEKIVKFLESYRPKLKQKIKDKHLYGFLERMAEDIVDENWPILTDEVRYQLRMSEFQPYVSMPDPEKVSCCDRMKGVYLYTVMPFDRSFGDQLRDWKWYVFLLITLIPFYGIQCFFYIFIFYCIDKEDEYQLISYILDFKKMQFFSMGCIQGIIGYYQYYNCVDLVPLESKAHIFGYCVQNGPGSNTDVVPDLISFFLNILLVWLALFCLPFSKQKGQPKFKVLDRAKQISPEQSDDKEQQSKGCCSCINWDRGGRLKYIMIWDICAFAFSTLIFYESVRFMNFDNIDKVYDWKPYIFFAKWVYGILSLPFLLFSIPVISSLLVRTRPTAYDQYGNCVPEKGVDIEYNKQPPEEVFDIDIGELLDKDDELNDNHKQ